MMSNHARQEIVEKYFEATIASDFHSLACLLDDNFMFWMVPSARQHGMQVPLSGKTAFLDFVRDLTSRPSMWRAESYIPEQFLFDETSVAVRLRLLGQFPNGFPYDNEYVFIFRFAEEKITEVREFTDPTLIATLFTAAGLAV